MKKILLICIATLFVGITRAEKLEVTLSASGNTTNSLIKQTTSGSAKSVDNAWNNGGQEGLMLNSDLTGLGGLSLGENTASIDFTSPQYTIFHSYSFDVWNDGSEKIKINMIFFTYEFDLTPYYGLNVDNPTTEAQKSSEKINNSSYSSNTLKFTTKRVGFKYKDYDKDYKIFSDNWTFGITIPEVILPREQTTTALTPLKESDLNNRIIQRTCTLTFTVKDPIGTTAATVVDYFGASIEPKSGDKWDLGTWSINNLNDNGKYEVKIPITYTATNKTSGNFEAVVKLKPKHSVNYEGKNYAEAKTQKVTIAVNQKQDYTIDWWQEWAKGGTITLYKGDSYKREDYLINTTGYTLGVPVISNQSTDNVLTIDESGTITASNEGTATLTYTQAGNDDYNAKVLTVNVQVIKRTPTFILNAEDTYEQGGETYYVFYPNKEYPIFVETDNTDYVHYPVTITPQGDVSNIISFDGISAETKSQPQEGMSITITQAEGDLWYRKEQTYKISVRHNPLHVGNICERSLCDLFDDRVVSLSREAKCESDKIILGSENKNTSGGYVVFQFFGSPDKLEWTYNTTAGGSNATWTAMQSHNGEDWVALGTDNTFNVDARYVKLAVSGSYEYWGTNYGAMGSITSLCITEKVGFDLNPENISLIQLPNGEVADATFNATISNLTAANVSIDGTNATDFEFKVGENSTFGSSYTISYADGLGIDKSAIIPITVKYTGDVNAADLLQKTCSIKVVGGDITKYVAVKIEGLSNNEEGVPSIIVKGTADLTGIQTGMKTGLNWSALGTDFLQMGEIVNQKNVLLASTFDDLGMALFDDLYIFGLTELAGDATDFVAATDAATNNAITPCYVYKKGTEGDRYVFDRKIENVNHGTKQLPIWEITGNKRLYFTGFCPFGSNGWSENDNGIIHIKGNAGASVDVYLEDCQLYSRRHTKFGNDRSYIDLGSTFTVPGLSNNETNNPAGGSASAIVFECTSSNNQSSPFKATIHTMGNNMLFSQLGTPGYYELIGKEFHIGQYCASLQVRAPSTRSYTVLSFDDKWPTDATRQFMYKRTNGMLRFRKVSTNSPSIEMGNSNTVVNFNGGQIELQNSETASPYYLNSLAICCRLGYAEYQGIPIYVGHGLGRDMTTGTVNFNDGTVNALPLYVQEQNRSYYDIDAQGYTTTIRCPERTYIMGGSHNVDVRACSAVDKTGASPTDSKGNTLVKVDYSLVSNTSVQVDASGLVIPTTLPDYIPYGDNEKLDLTNYGKESLSPDVNRYLHFWAPGAGRKEYAITSWVVCMPRVEAGVSGVNTYDVILGGEKEVPSTETDKVNYLMYAQVDEAILGLFENNSYQAPTIVPGSSPTTYQTVAIKEKPTTKYMSILNQDSYTISENIYYIKAVNADEWMLFSPPFDVSNVYVIESYPENELVNLAQTSRTDAIAMQAQYNMDLASMVITSMNNDAANGHNYSFDYHYSAYLAYASNTTNKVGTNYSAGVKKEQLYHFTGSNFSQANYYLYKSADAIWEYEDGAFKTDWQIAQPVNKTIGQHERTVIMEQGGIYALQFPYCPGCNDGSTWDYWTGKMIVFEGYGPQTIEGTGESSRIAGNTSSSGDLNGQLRGNSVFAEYDATGVTNAHFYSDISYEFDDDVDDLGLLAPGDVCIVTNFSLTKSGMPAKRVNFQTGAVTWMDEAPGQGNTTTSTPTIADNHQLLVYTIEGGVGIIPVTAQQVSIYNAAGQLITSQYLTDEVQISLPTGIYLVCGEKDQAKVIVK